MTHLTDHALTVGTEVLVLVHADGSHAPGGAGLTRIVQVDHTRPFGMNYLVRLYGRSGQWCTEDELKVFGS